MPTEAAIAALLSLYGFAQFSRLSARRAGLEDALRIAEAADRAKFVRCAGVSSGMPYFSDNELFRMVS